ncbi:uncharacterized protein TNCV_1797341 [Trichonephila clavipes]|nr:uncharacterized protein TNCV_1797341 [Trichonephila clavipes]
MTRKGVLKIEECHKGTPGSWNPWLPKTCSSAVFFLTSRTGYLIPNDWCLDVKCPSESGVPDNWRFNSRRRFGQSDNRFHNQGGRQGGSRKSSFRGPVELPYVPILLNETFITSLWDIGAEKSFISEEVYRRYFAYRPRQKTKDRVVTAQGALVAT